LQAWIKRWPQGVEIAVILLIAFGPFVASSQLPHSDKLLLNDGRLLSILLAEGVLGLLLVGLLYARGWKWSDFDVNPTIQSTVLGIVLAPLSLVLIGLFGFSVMKVLANDMIKPPAFQMVASSAYIILVCVLNSLYEEVFVLAYVVRALEKLGGFWSSGAVIVAFSALLRTSYHTYQGAYGIMMVLPLGLAWGWLYYRQRNLWPLILAHGVIDIIAFTQNSR
jgi:membrane protease YdiL (CAAX protease family)